MAREAPGSLERLRAQNRTRALAVLQRRGMASQADIVRETGLSRTTVSSLVAELLDEGVVVERDSARQAPSPSGGRPPTLLSLEPSSGGFVGIDFGREIVRVAVANRAGELLVDARSERLEVAHEAQKALDAADQMVSALLDEAELRPDQVIGAGVAVSAPVRSDAPGFASGVIFPAWAEVNATDILTERLDVPVHLENDANLGALAEATFGAGRGRRNIFYVMLSEGIGGGVIVDGRIYTGQTGAAGELGHIVVDPDGQVCRCGNRGCLATIAGGAALTAALRQTHGPEVTLDELIALSQGGDPGATRLIGDAGQAVGRVLASACGLLDPECVIIGGELAPAGKPLLDNIRQSLDRWISPAAGHKYPVQAGELGAKAEVFGAIALAMSHVPDQTLDPASAPATDPAPA
ncbi:MAG TPA: ROK family transcriptional regulator [Solirubrobacteraceae bacterium]|nr:ROK family transcriptional regulator [Solirubrobacteraceae bacterium]